MIKHTHKWTLAGNRYTCNCGKSSNAQKLRQQVASDAEYWQLPVANILGLLDRKPSRVINGLGYGE